MCDSQVIFLHARASKKISALRDFEIVVDLKPGRLVARQSLAGVLIANHRPTNLPARRQHPRKSSAGVSRFLHRASVQRAIADRTDRWPSVERTPNSSSQ
jgi:hypothetical protein